MKQPRKKRDNELPKRIAWTLLLIFIFLFGQKIMLPNYRQEIVQSQLSNVNYLQVLGLMTGGSMTAPAILSLGLGPYMTGMIVWQAVMALDLPVLNRMRARTMGIVNKLVAFAFALLQAFEMTYWGRDALIPEYLPGSSYNISFLISMLILGAGAMLAISMAEFNQTHGIGGPIALIIPGIIAGLPNSLRRGWGRTPLTLTHELLLFTFIICFLLIIVCVMVNDAEVRIPLVRPMLDSTVTDSYFSIKFLPAGAMPFMFSSTIFTLPREILSNNSFGKTPLGQGIMTWTDYTAWQGVVTYAIIIILLGYAFGYINVQPAKTARGLRSSGDYFYNTLPGDATEKVLSHHFFTISTISNTFLLFLGDGPMLVGLWYRGAANYSLVFGAIFILVTMLVSIGWQVQALWVKNHNRLFDIEI